MAVVWSRIHSAMKRVRRTRVVVAKQSPEDDRSLATSDADFITPAGWTAVPQTILLASQPSDYLRKH